MRPVFGVTRSSAALTATFLDGKERLFAGNPIDAFGLAADPQLAYRWFYNGYLIAGANAASYSDSVLEKLPSGSYICETNYTDRAGRRQTVASAPLLVEPTREGSGLRVLRTSLDERMRASLESIQPGLQASPEVLQLRLPFADSSSLPSVSSTDITATGAATGDSGLVALFDPVAILDPNQDGPATVPLAESGQSGAGVYDFDSDGQLDTLTWQPQPDGTSSPTLNSSLLTGGNAVLSALSDGSLRFLHENVDGILQPLKQPALQCLSVFLLESPAQTGTVITIRLREGETLEGLSADQRRQRAIHLISNQDDTPAPLESYADRYRQLWVRADQAMVLLELPGGNASDWDGSLLSEPLKVVAPLQDPLSDPLPDSPGSTLELASASGLRLGLKAESVPVDLDGFVARSQASAPVIDCRGLEGLTLDITLEVAREAGFESRMGFYAIEDLDGSVRDLISGELVKPGEADYARLAQSHLVEALSDLGTENLQSTSKDLWLSESRLLAPIAVVQNPESGPQTFYAFAAANPDLIGHFRSFGNNVIGLEDLPGGGDFDFDDNMVHLQINPLVF